MPLHIKIDNKANETGLAVEACIQRVMKAQGLEHPLDALQYMVEHLVAVSVAVGIPAVAVIASCMDAIQAGNSPKVREDIERLFGEFQKGH